MVRQGDVHECMDALVRVRVQACRGARVRASVRAYTGLSPTKRGNLSLYFCRSLPVFCNSQLHCFPMSTYL